MFATVLVLLSFLSACNSTSLIFFGLSRLFFLIFLIETLVFCSLNFLADEFDHFVRSFRVFDSGQFGGFLYVVIST